MVSTSNDDIARSVAGKTIATNFLETVRQRPDSVAIRWATDSGAVEVTYRDYAAQAAHLAAALADLGVEHGVRVVLLIRNRPEFHVADVATLLAGGTPISIYNSSSPEQIRYLVHHCGAERGDRRGRGIPRLGPRRCAPTSPISRT